MAVAKNDSGTPNATSGTSVATLDLTTYTVSAGSNLVLLAGLTLGGSNSGTPTMFWDALGANQAMTLVTSVTTSGAPGYLFILINPVAGNKTLRATWVTTRPVCVGAIAFAGADQTTGIVGADTKTNTGSTAGSQSTGAVNSTSDGATVGLCGFSGTTLSSTTSGTEVYRVSPAGSVWSALSYQLGATPTFTHTWSSPGSGAWNAIGVHVIAAAGGPSTVSRRTLGPRVGSRTW